MISAQSEAGCESYEDRNAYKSRGCSIDNYIVILTRSVLPTYAGRNFDGPRPILGMAGACLDARVWVRAWPENCFARWEAPKAIFNASLTELESHRLPAAVAQMIHTRQPMSAAAKELAQAQAAGIRLLTWDEPEYPQRLREIYDPPPLLYVRGNIELLNRHLISIVGSRRPTPYGNQMAEKLARDLADRGLVIVSGLARGIDSCAHKGALSSLTGATIGVLGCGIDVIYPKENKKIFARDGKARRDHLRICDGHVPRPAKLPDSEPDHFGNVCRGGGR